MTLIKSVSPLDVEYFPKGHRKLKLIFVFIKADKLLKERIGMRILPTNWTRREEWMRWTLHTNTHRVLFSSSISCSAVSSTPSAIADTLSYHSSDEKYWNLKIKKFETCKHSIIQHLCRWFYYLKASWFLCLLSLFHLSACV